MQENNKKRQSQMQEKFCQKEFLDSKLKLAKLRCQEKNKGEKRANKKHSKNINNSDRIIKVRGGKIAATRYKSYR